MIKNIKQRSSIHSYDYHYHRPKGIFVGGKASDCSCCFHVNKVKLAVVHVTRQISLIRSYSNINLTHVMRPWGELQMALLKTN